MLAIMPCVMTQAVLAGPWSYTDIGITKKSVELFFRYWAEEKIITHKRNLGKAYKEKYILDKMF